MPPLKNDPGGGLCITPIYLALRGSPKLVDISRSYLPSKPIANAVYDAP